MEKPHTSTKYVQRTWSSDQRMRSVEPQTANRYTIDLPESVNNIVGVKLLNAYIPRSEYTIDSHNDSIDYEIIKWTSSETWDGIKIETLTIPHGQYTIEELLEYLTNNNENLIFQISDIKTNRVIITLQQIPNFAGNGFRFLFGSGPNNFRSAARVLGFELGKDSDVSTPPELFKGILPDSKDIITTTNSYDVGYIIENKRAVELGIVDNWFMSSQYILSITDLEYEYYSNITNQFNDLYEISVSINKVNPQIYKFDSFKSGCILNDGSKLYIYTNSTNYTNSYAIIKLNNNTFINEFDTSSNINLISFPDPQMLNNISNTLVQNYVDEVNFSYEIQTNCFLYFYSNKNSISFFKLDETFYVYYQTHINELDYIAYDVNYVENPANEFRTTPHSEKLDFSSIWSNISFEFNDNCIIFEPYNIYKGNKRLLIKLQENENFDISNLIELQYNSVEYPNSIGIKFLTHSVVVSNNHEDIYIHYNCPDLGTFKFRMINSNSFYWSYDPNFTNSEFINTNCFATIPFDTTNSVIYFNSNTAINSFKLFHPSMYNINFLTGDTFDDDTFDNNHINSINIIPLTIHSHIDIDIIFVQNVFEYGLTLEQSFSSVVHFYTHSIYYDNNSITLYVNNSDNSYTYSIFFSSVNSNETFYVFDNSISSNSFNITLSSLGWYKVVLNSTKQYESTHDEFYFRYINDKLEIHSHFYQHSTDQYIINSFTLPDSQNSIKVNDIIYYPNCIIAFDSFSNCNSPIIIINDNSFYFENCVYNNIYFSSVYTNCVNCETFIVTFTPSSMHYNIKYYKVNDDEYIDSTNSYSYIFNSLIEKYSFHYQESSKLFVFQGYDIHSNPYGNSIQYIIYNKYKYYNSPLIITPVKHNDNSIAYLFNSMIYYNSDSILLNSIKTGNSIHLEDMEYTISQQSYPNVYIHLNENSYLLNFETSMFDNSFELFTTSTKFDKIIYKRNILWKDIEFPISNNSEYNAYISDEKKSIILNKNDVENIYIYKNYVLNVNIKSGDISNSTFIICRPVIDTIFELNINKEITNNNTFNDFFSFQYKQIISPYRYDLEKTPIIQVVCERVGNLYTQMPIGFYNFQQEIVIPNKISFPVLSKASKIEISLKRRDSTIDKLDEENIYYEWNGMEHTLIVQFECLETLSDLTS